MTAIIHIPGDTLLATLDERGWRKGGYGNESPDGAVCLYGAIRICAPIPGDAYLVEQVKQREGRGTGWNDDTATTEADVRAWINGGVDVTDAELAATYGPQWQATVVLVRTLAALTPDQVKGLAAAWVAARDAARDAAWAAAWDAAWAAARDAAWAAARDAARDAARAAARDAAGVAARDAARAAARDAARDAAGAVTTWDLATPDGPYTHAQRDLLIAPFRAVFGDITPLLDEVAA